MRTVYFVTFLAVLIFSIYQWTVYDGDYNMIALLLMIGSVVSYMWTKHLMKSKND
jgi:hypothetical protein